MRWSLRARFMGWMLFLLVLFFVVQTSIFLVYEVREWRAMEQPDWSEEQGELLILLGVDAVVLPFMVLAMWLVSKRMLRPVRAIVRTSQRIGSGHLDERIRVANPTDEIGLLAATINDAFDQYQEAVRRLQRFSADASHQLRTPLTAIRSTGEVCLQRERAPGEYRETIESMMEEVQRLCRTVEQLLMLARLDPAVAREHFGLVDLGGVVEEAVEPYLQLAEDKAIALSVRTESGLEVEGDPLLLGQVAANILDNAIRATPEKGRITIEVAPGAAGEAVLTIADSGPGIPPASRETIFDRFGKAPGPVTGGAGLGLAIVADIVKVHGGRIELPVREQAGAVFRIVLPALDAARPLFSALNGPSSGAGAS